MNIASFLTSARTEASHLLQQVEKVLLPALESKVTSFLKAFGVTDDQIGSAEVAVTNAAKNLASAPGGQKRAAALDELKTLAGELEPYLANLLIDAVFGYLRAAGTV